MQGKAIMILEKCIISVYDSIEACILSVTISAGKRTLKVCGVILVLLLVSLSLTWLKLPCFISWQEAIAALGIAVIIAAVDCGNQNAIKKIRSKMKGVEVSNDEQQCSDGGSIDGTCDANAEGR